MASKRNVKYVQQAEPSFLKKFKARVGYKESASINDKFSEEKDDSSCENEREIAEEEPVIVVLKHGDLTAAEVAEYKQENSNTDFWDNKTDKPKFKKPEKRPSGDNDMKDSKRKKTNVKAVKNSKLLSFDDEDGDGEAG